MMRLRNSCATRCSDLSRVLLLNPKAPSSSRSYWRNLHALQCGLEVVSIFDHMGRMGHFVSAETVAASRPPDPIPRHSGHAHSAALWASWNVGFLKR